MHDLVHREHLPQIYYSNMNYGVLDNEIQGIQVSYIESQTITIALTKQKHLTNHMFTQTFTDIRALGGLTQHKLKINKRKHNKEQENHD